MSEEYKDILLTEEEKEKIKKKSPESLPLNPTAQGWSSSQIRKKMSEFVTGEEDSVLKTLQEKLSKVEGFFVGLNTKFPRLVNGLIPDEYISKKITVEVYTVETFEDLLLLEEAYIGDIVKVNSEGISYILKNTPYTERSNWLIYVDENTYKDIYAFNSIDSFPAEGAENKLYLAKKQNTALEGEEEVWVDYNMLYRWDTELMNYIPVAGQGGTGGGTTDVAPRVSPFPSDFPIVFSHAYGESLTIGYRYSNSLYEYGTRMLYVNDIIRSTELIAVGEHEFDITNFLVRGLNTIKIYVVDAEGRAAQLIYRVTADSVILTSSFNDAKVYKQEGIILPYTVTTPATIKRAQYIIDGIASEVVLDTTNVTLIFEQGDLTHGVHRIEIKVIGDFYKDNVFSYSIESPTLYFDVLYDDGVTATPMISSKFNELEQKQGEAFAIDYVAYTPNQEYSTIELYIDSVLKQTLTVGVERLNWYVNNLSLGSHSLKIKNNTVEKTFNVIIGESDLLLEVVKDSFLKLYLDGFGKSNLAYDKNEWQDLYENDIQVTLSGLNFSTDGWIDNSLRLIPTSNALINFKPFEGAMPSSGKTLEFDIRTRQTTNQALALIQCLYNDIGFIIKPNSIELKGSNITTTANFKEDEHLTVSFVIDPTTKMIITYINGVISGLNFLTPTTSFRQMEPDNIHINPNEGSIDVFSIRYYNRALTAKEMLNNYLASIDDVALRLEKYYFNDIYDDYGNISLEKISEKIPVMKIEGSPLPIEKMSKPRPPINVYFEHPFEPSKNFEQTGMRCQINAQGTSSLAYPIKNFRIYLDDAYQMEDFVWPEDLFTLKADYMDSSHSHNTGLAKLFDSMYEGKIPPKEFNANVRTAIYGYPMALFHRLNPTDQWEYKGIYNFNLDKDNHRTLGLETDYEYEEGNPASAFPLAQSFEIAFNADASAGAYQSDDLGSVVMSFEPRSPEIDEYDYYVDEDIAPFQMLTEAKTKLKEYTTNQTLKDAIDAANYDELIDIFDVNFLATPDTTPDPIYPMYSFPIIATLKVFQTTYAPLRNAIRFVIDNNGSINFRNNFESHFNLEYHLKYLIVTLVFGLVDNLGKNAMMNTWDGQIFYPNFYDIDTAMGVDNVGQLVHDYDIEIGDTGAYATAESWLWKNILEFFTVELEELYGSMRTNVLSYENILEYLYEQQISKISESQYNADAFAKYIGITTQWLFMAQGTTLEHKKRWLTQRLAFLDSKFKYLGYISNSIVLRMNLPEGAPDPSIEVTYIITQYAGVKFGEAYTKYGKTPANVPITITAPITEINQGGGAITFMETSIHGSQWISKLGNVSHLYPSFVSIELAPRIEELLVGSIEEGYSNPNLTTAAIGSNTYLKKVDFRNCINLGSDPDGTQVLDLSGATNIKEVLLGNTALKGVSFASGSSANLIQLPSTITELILRNMNDITNEGLELQGVSNLKTFWTENIDNLDVISLFNTLTNVENVRMIGIDYSLYGIQPLLDLIDKVWDSTTETYKLYGLDNLGQVIDTPIISGVFKILTTEEVSQAQINLFNQILPDLDIQINQVPEGLTMMELEDGTLELVSYEGSALTSLIIPAEFNSELSELTPIVLNTDGWKTVTRIGSYAFYGKSINQITIPSTITTIEQYAFSNSSSLELIAIPSSVEVVETNAFGSNTNVLILVQEETKPDAWSSTWNGDVTNILWGVPFENRTFVFNTMGGSSISNITDRLLIEPPTPPTYFGYTFNGWLYNGEPVTFPFVPEASDLQTITFIATWTQWIYTVNYMIPTSDIDSTLVLHATQQVTFGDNLGAFFTENTTGSNIPVVSGLQFYSKWKLEDDTLATSSYIPNQDVNTDGNVIELIGQFISTQGLVLTYDAVEDVYNVTGFSLSSTTMPDGSINLFIPATWNDGINGIKPVRNVNLNSATASHRIKIGSITVEDGVNGVFKLNNTASTVLNYMPYVSSIKIPSSMTIENLWGAGIKYTNPVEVQTPVTLIYDMPELITFSLNALSFSAITEIKVNSDTLNIGYDAQDVVGLTKVIISNRVKQVVINSSSTSFFKNVNHFIFEIEQGNTFFKTTNGGKILYGNTLNPSSPEFRALLISAPIINEDIVIPAELTDLRFKFTFSSANSYITSVFETMSVNNIVIHSGVTLPTYVTSITDNSTLFFSCYFKPKSYKLATTSSTYTIYDNAIYNSNKSNLIALGRDSTSIDFSNLTVISASALSHAGWTSSDLIIPNSVSLQYDNGFNLFKKIIINSSFNIDSFSMQGSPNLEEVVFNGTYSGTRLGSYAFMGCTSLVTISIPTDSNIVKIPTSAFNGCSSLTSITIPENITTIDSFAFSGCSSLTSITIPENITTIEMFTFSSCSSLASITLNEGLLTIKNDAFENCISLTSITIPSTVTSIGSDGFHDCASLAVMTLLPTTPPTLGDGDALDGHDINRVIYVPTGTLSAYQNATNWNEYSADIEEVI